MKCPNCASATSDDAPECPSCGLIFAKWRERQEKEKLEALAELEKLGADAPSPARSPWFGRGVAGAVVLAWMIALSLFIYRRARDRRPPLGVDTGIYAEYRDPKTGEVRRMPVRRLGVPAGPPTVPAAPAPDASGQ